MLSSCGWLNKNISLTCTLARLFVTAAPHPHEPQGATNPSFDRQADTGELSQGSSLSLPVTVNEQLEKRGSLLQ